MATIREVAKKSGVSIGTVSNVLNARDWKVSAATREKVLAAVRELNYQPAPALLRHEPQGTKNIVVLFPRPRKTGPLGDSLYVSSTYMNALIDGMLEESARNGWSLTLLVQPDLDSDEPWLRKFVDGRCEGVILVNQTRDSSIDRALIERGTPVVCLGSHPDNTEAPCVDVDNVDAARTLVRHLFSLGHRNIAHIAGNFELSCSHERADVYRSEMERAGVAQYIRIEWGEYVFEEGYKAGTKLLRSKDRPTAIFCGNDDIAWGVLRAAHEFELRVPDDLSVVGFDDAPVPGREPVLTTARQPLRRMGARAVSTIITRSTDSESTPKSILLAGEFILRQTTGPVPTPNQACVPSVS